MDCARGDGGTVEVEVAIVAGLGLGAVVGVDTLAGAVGGTGGRGGYGPGACVGAPGGA